jgi:NAD(P)-dependent dehydrogenase (short-subunit alcohol dehydrogenase family)
MSNSNKEKCSIVTGVSGGIGKAIYKKLIEGGVNVLGIDLKEPAQNLNIENFLKVDLNRFADNEQYSIKIINEINKWLNGRELHLIVNNAATQIIADVPNITRASYQLSLNVNLLAPFFLIQAFIDQLIASKGCVINISSIHARMTKPKFLVYATSKSAISSMNRSLAVELGSEIAFYAIEPGAVMTDMLRQGFEEFPELLVELANCHPSKEISTPEQLGEFILFLFNSRISALQGTAIEFGGGISSRIHDPM